MSSKTIRLLVMLVLAVGIGVVGLYAVEAHKEARVLCGLFKPGTSEREMDRVLATANWLQTVDTREYGQTVRVVHSRWNVGMAGCRVVLENGGIASNESWNRF